MKRLQELAPFEVSLGEDFPVVLRPVRPGDEGRARRAFSLLSRQSRLNRFWQSGKVLPGPALERLVETNHASHVAWVALPREENSAVPGYGAASFWREEEDLARAEFSITVADDWQRRGVGALLLAVLWEEAVALGIRTFFAVGRRDNHAIRAWWASAGGEVVERATYLEMSLRLADPRSFAGRTEYDLHAGAVRVDLANWFRHWEHWLGD